MWPTSHRFVDPNKTTANSLQQQSSQSISKSLASVDSNQLLMAADSLRTLFGNNISPNLLRSDRENPSTDLMDTTLSQMTSRRPPERHVIDYGSPNYSRLDRNRVNQMSSDFGTDKQRFNDSPPLMTETRIYDPTKMPQKSILKKSKDQPFETNFRTIEDEDLYLYGNPNMPSIPSTSLPPGIVSLEQQNERSPSNERSLSPISLRLKREMEKMDRSHRISDHNEYNHWTPRIGQTSSTAIEEPIRRNEWNDEEEEHFKRRYRDLMNPSPDRSLELEKVRIQQLAAIQAGILTQSNKPTKRREPSPNSSLRHSDYSTYRRNSPESSPKRVRRRSPSPSPRRRRSISPRRRSRSPRKRSVSPRRRSISPRSRRNYRSRSRDHNRRSRSHSPQRRSPNSLSTQMNAINPMPSMMPMRSPMVSGMSFMPHQNQQNLVGMPMGPIIGQYIQPPPMVAPYHTFFSQNIRPNIPNNVSPKQRSALREVPIDKSPHSQTSAKKPAEKKEDKLLNPHDLLVAERAKLREELEALNSQHQRKKDEQDIIAKKDGGTDSYAYRQLDKTIKDLKNAIASKHDKLIKNFELINEVQKSKSKAKAVMEQLKASGDISKVDLKKKETDNRSKGWPTTKTKSPEKKSTKEESKEDKKEEIDDEEEDEKSSRFHYFDSGPHWCKDCNKFVDNMKQYFSHIHSKEHMSKQKEPLKAPWITKDYTKQMDKPVVRNKDQLVVASKGIYFILPTHGFFCELCDQFLHDSYQAEKHFKSAKHNRSYTRYTLLHNDYEHKWKSERDRAFTEMKRKERELEKEKSKKEAEKKIEDRKRLEEEVKRKDREVKERIEAMNKNLKSIKELDDPKVEHKKDDKNKSPKSSIRLNLSSSKNSNESPDKSKSSEKIGDKKDKSKDKPKDKSEEKANKSTKSESMDTSDGIEDMLVIDEINCDSIEENNEILENQNSNENIDENALLYPEKDEKDSMTHSKVDVLQENKVENSGKTTQIIQVMDTSEEELKQMDEENSNSFENKTELNDKNDNSDQIEGVVPQINDSKNSNLSETEELNICQTSANERESTDNSHLNTDSELKTSGELQKPAEDSIESSEAPKQDPKEGSADPRTMTYAEAVAKGSDGLEDNAFKSVESKKKSPECVDKSGSNDTEEDENKSNLLDTNSLKTENMFDIDLDIENFNKRLKNLDSMVKKENIEGEVDEDDPLDGFDVIDETNNEDNNRIVNNTEDVIELSD